MELPSKNKRQFVVLVNVCRLLLALALMLSGFLKAVDPMGGVYKLQEYATAFSFHGISDAWLQAASMAQAAVEFLIGLYLLMGVYRCVVPLMALVLMSLFTPFSLYLWVSGVVTDCGCFGDAWVLTNWQSFAKNVVLLTCAIVVAVRYRLQTRLISIHTQWLVNLYNWMYAFVLTLYCMYTLPVIDFRPYHIGADLHAKMQWDETDRIPPINDLWISDPLTGEDMTDSIISGKGWKFLIVAPRLENADDGVMDKLAELTEYCLEHEYMLTALTASSDSLIEHWRDITGAEYPFLVADEIPLKTMVRSNPGLILLEGSVVANKWASSQIPGASQLTAPLEDMSWVRQEKSTYMQRFMLLLSWYVIPLLILTILDKIWLGIKTIRERKKKDI